MPRLFDVFGWIIFIWSNEGKPTECVHVHIGKRASSNATKVWILKDGTAKVAYNNSRIPNKDLRRLLQVIEDNNDEIIDG